MEDNALSVIYDAISCIMCPCSWISLLSYVWSPPSANVMYHAQMLHIQQLGTYIQVYRQFGEQEVARSRPRWYPFQITTETDRFHKKYNIVISQLVLVRDNHKHYNLVAVCRSRHINYPHDILVEVPTIVLHTLIVTRKGDKSISSKKPDDSAQVQHNNNATLPTGAYNIKQTTCLVSYNVESPLRTETTTRHL